jgi:hypothetical protein
MELHIDVQPGDVQRALGLVTAYLERPGPGLLPPDYVNQLREDLDEMGPIKLTHALVTIATTLVIGLASAHDTSREETLRRIALVLANYGQGREEEA